MSEDSNTISARLRVLVVEDEFFVAMDLENLLADMNHEVVGSAQSVARGIELVEETRPDVALLDVNLNGELVTPVAEALEANHTPFVVLTGYAFEHLEGALSRASAVINKPVNPDELRRKLARLGGSPGRD